MSDKKLKRAFARVELAVVVVEACYFEQGNGAMCRAWSSEGRPRRVSFEMAEIDPSAPAEQIGAIVKEAMLGAAATLDPGDLWAASVKYEADEKRRNG